MHGVSTINIELTSRCNKTAKEGLFKACHMCGRRKLEKQNPDYESILGDMPIEMVELIAAQIPAGTVVQLHWNGDPMLYKLLSLACVRFKKRGAYVCMDTNGLLIGSLACKLQYVDSITVSVIQGDSIENYNRQMQQINEFLLWRYAQQMDTKLVIRALGKIPVYFEPLADQWNVKIVRRQFHAPEMSRNYQRETVKPEIGVCLDLLHHPAIDRHGNVFPCVRYNPEGLNCLGNVSYNPLEKILGGKKRLDMIEAHFAGRRGEVELCRDCHYYGIPRG